MWLNRRIAQIKMNISNAHDTDLFIVFENLLKL